MTDNRPLWKDGYEGRYIYHDRVDDALTIADLPAATYTAVAALYGGAQVWEFYHAGGDFTLPVMDWYEFVIYDGVLSATDSAGLIQWMELLYTNGNIPAVPDSEVGRMWVTGTHSFSTGEIGDAGITWLAGNMQTGSGRYFDLVSAVPTTVSIRMTNPEEFDYFYEANELFGSMPLFPGCVNMTYILVGFNNFSGSIPAYLDKVLLEDLTFSSNNFTGKIPSIAHLTVLNSYNCDTNNLSGPIPSVLPSTLKYLQIHDNSLSGDIPDLSGTSMYLIHVHNNKLTGYAGGGINDAGSGLRYFDATNNLLTQEAVDLILSDFVDANHTVVSNENIRLGGTGNATPSAAGLADKATLISRGWSVTTN